MDQSIKCIFCGKESQATVEHVVPEFLGGSLVIKEVCQTCNSKMGSDFEGPISRSVIFRLPRHFYKIQGKSTSTVNAFPNIGIAEDGTKVKLDSNFKPYMITKTEESRIEDGGVKVNLMVDVSDKEKLPKIIEAKIRRIAKKEWPDMSEEDVNSLVQNALESLPTKYEVEKFRPTIKYNESINLNHLTLLMMKIAYEIAFYHHGVGILSDSSNIKLRDAINARDSKAEVGRLFPEPDPFLYITASDNSHCIVLCQNICYLRLFNISAIIQVSDNKSKFSLSEEEWVIYWFNFVEKTWRKESFLSHVSKNIL